jgi:DNA-binding transcriptional LysR family regulator
MKRTHLPLNGMRVFDAAARHLSFTKAADELAVTPAAVGQQIRALEDMLGVVLFRRTPKGLELTPEAEKGLDALRAGFLQFEESVRAMQSGQTSNYLTIAAPRDFTAKWLTPRLARYGAANPDLQFTLVSADGEVDFTEANLDIAIRLADGPGEHEGVKLGSGSFVRVGAPDGGAKTPGPAALLPMVRQRCGWGMPGWPLTPPPSVWERPLCLTSSPPPTSMQDGFVQWIIHETIRSPIGCSPPCRNGGRKR